MASSIPAARQESVDIAKRQMARITPTTKFREDPARTLRAENLSQG